MPKAKPGITVIRRGDGSTVYRAEVYDRVTDRRAYRTFPTQAAALGWRRDEQARLRAGTSRVLEPTTLAQAWERWQGELDAGTLKNRSGQPYKPSVVKAYVYAFDAHLLPALGGARLSDLRAVHVQGLVDRLVAGGLAAQTVRNVVTALRVVLKWAVRKELAVANACDNVALPAGGAKRDRIASPSEALELLGALPAPEDRALWATAFFAGLRRGELGGLEWGDVDLLGQTIRVRQAWNPETATMGLPKSKAGLRTLSVPRILVPYLAALDGTEGLVFGRGPAQTAGATAKRVWERAGLQPIGLHEARHTYASLMIAAGVNVKTLQSFMGHSSITVTLDRYGHLLPGSGAVAAELLDAYLEKELG